MMGYGGYSSSSRSLRSSAKHLVKVKADDMDLLKDSLSGHSFSLAGDGTYLVSINNTTEANRLESNLASLKGLSFANMDDAMAGYDHRSRDAIFSGRQINNSMNPHGVKIRESRDSADHPNSLAIVLGLDETGSMGSVPHFLVKEGLPNLMDKIIKGGVADPQVLFLGIGDHECDNAPLQVGQFESNDELLDKWLTDVYLEGRGGGNDGESYLLAWYFAAYHTAIDCLEKRGRKGYCITIGDEPTLRTVPETFLRRLMGEGQYQTFSALELLDKAREKYLVHHIHIRETGAGSSRFTMDGWKQLLSDGLHIAERRSDVADIIASIILSGEAKVNIYETPSMISPEFTKTEDIIR